MKRFAILSLLIAGCSSQQEVAVDNTSIAEMNSTATVEPELATADPWSFSEGVDAITDDRTYVSQTKVEGAANDIEVQVTCLPGKPTIIYAINGFDKDGDGAPMDKSFSGGTVYNKVIFRSDSKEPRGFTNYNPQYNNQTIIKDETTFLGNAWLGTEAASASTLTLRIQFTNANETYSINQESRNFRNTVQPCLLAQRAVEKKDEDDRAEAGRLAEQPLPEAGANNADEESREENDESTLVNAL